MINVIDEDYVIDKIIKYLYEYGINKYITSQMQHKMLLNYAICSKKIYNYINIEDFNLKTDHEIENKITICKTDSKNIYKLTDKNLSQLKYKETTCNQNRYLLYLYNIVQVKNIAYKKHTLQLKEYKPRIFKKDIRKTELLKEFYLNKIKDEHIEFELCKRYIIENTIKLSEVIEILLYLINNSNYDIHMDIDKSIREISNANLINIPSFIYNKVLEYNIIKHRENIIIEKFNERGMNIINTKEIDNYIKFNIGNLQELITKYEFLIKHTNYLTSLDESLEYKRYNGNFDLLPPFIKKQISLTKSAIFRKQEIKEQLKKYNLSLREDSVLCKNYINYYIGNAEKIASTMNEMNFYYTYTIYPKLIKDDDYRMSYGSEGCKNIALKKYCNQNFKNYNDIIKSAKIPVSLYSKIKELY